MKTPQEWQIFFFEHQMHHASYPVPPIEFIELVQKDALSDPMASATDQQELEMARSIAINERIRADQLYEEMMKMKDKWHKTRHHLRAANKGAYRNALIAELATLKQTLLKNNQTKTN
jgi:hypothetical protein